jgi:hypothetical protein
VSKPLLNQTSSVRLVVDTDRRLRADAIVAPIPNNALEVRTDGLYVADFQPVGGIIHQRALGGQVIPVFTGLATPTATPIIYDSSPADPSGMWDPTLPTRLTIVRDGRYIVSSWGKYRSTGTFGTSGKWLWAWVGLNGDELNPVAFYNSNTNGPLTDPASLATPAGSPSEALTFTHHMQAMVELHAGDYLSTFVVCQDTGLSGNTMSTQATVAGAVVPNFVVHALAAVQVAPL